MTQTHDEKMDEIAMKVVGALVQFCKKENIENPKIKIQASFRSERYLLTFERLDLDKKG